MPDLYDIFTTRESGRMQNFLIGGGEGAGQLDTQYDQLAV